MYPKTDIEGVVKGWSYGYSYNVGPRVMEHWWGGTSMSAKLEVCGVFFSKELSKENREELLGRK